MNVAEFREDLKTMTLNECLKKHNVDLNTAFKLSTLQTLPPNTRVNPMAYIRKTKHRTYRIVKYFGKHDEHMRYNGFGTYKTLKEAQAIRDELIQVNWDKSKLEEIKDKLNIVDSCGR